MELTTAVEMLVHSIDFISQQYLVVSSTPYISFLRQSQHVQKCDYRTRLRLAEMDGDTTAGEEQVPICETFQLLL